MENVLLKAKKILNAIDQTGPVKLISIPLTEDIYPALNNISICFAVD